MSPSDHTSDEVEPLGRSMEEDSRLDEEPPPPDVDYGALVERIRTADPMGMEDLYRIFSRGVRYYLCRQLGSQELEDKVHDTFLIVVQAIRRGDLREPERLMGFIRTVVRRQVAAHIENAVHNRRDQLDLEMGATLADFNEGPEQTAIVQQKAELMEKILRGLNKRDREILTRFYLDEQPQEQICEEMQLTDTQFRLLKSRAKTRFGELGRKKLAKRPIRSFFMRTSLSA
ncbi:MAG: sigma-70 family RNA polymerase sigma factor [Bryobacterales bacterium]|nr:sigma-70 family RNA polymerase sigma factor [Bryobacterales bacterium]